MTQIFRKIIVMAALALAGVATAFSSEAYRTWVPDILGDSIVMRYVRHPDDYQGHVRSAIIRRMPQQPVTKGVLYVHGYNDYFFQREMARQFNRHGYAFYAVDLRKYGRSILPGQKKYDARDLSEYFPDLDSALVDMQRAGISEIVLMGHSTGGLVSSFYLARHANPVKVDALILNSPFLDWNVGSVEWLIPAVSAVGYLFPDLPVPQGKSTAYGESLLGTKHGEWAYCTEWKSTESSAVSAGWIRAIDNAQKELRKGNRPIRVPVLLMYSARSHRAEAWDPECNNADVVLDVGEIKRYGLMLATDVTCVRVNGGLHDLLLSRKGLRDPLYNEIFAWLTKNL